MGENDGGDDQSKIEAHQQLSIWLLINHEMRIPYFFNVCCATKAER